MSDVAYGPLVTSSQHNLYHITIQYHLVITIYNTCMLYWYTGVLSLLCPFVMNSLSIENQLLSCCFYIYRPNVTFTVIKYGDKLLPVLLSLTLRNFPVQNQCQSPIHCTYRYIFVLEHAVLNTDHSNYNKKWQVLKSVFHLFICIFFFMNEEFLT